MNYIALEGPIKHGKTTLASMLQEAEPNSIHLESSSIIMEVANEFQEHIIKPVDYTDLGALNAWLEPLPGILKEVVHVYTKHESLQFSEQDIVANPRMYEKLFSYARDTASNPEMLRQAIDIQNKNRYRHLLQWLGGYLPKMVDDEIWFNEMVRRFESAENESENEEFALGILSAVRTAGDERVVRRVGGTIIRVLRADLLETDIQDPTENYRKYIRPDTIVHNNGTKDDLQTVASNIIHDMYHGGIKGLYFASQDS